jgi:hypothetical protein
MKLTGTITFRIEDRFEQAHTTGIQREKGEIALDFKMDDDCYTVVLRRVRPDSLAGEFVRKSHRTTGHATCDVYRGTKGKQVLMGNGTEEGFTYFWFAQLAPV